MVAVEKGNSLVYVLSAFVSLHRLKEPRNVVPHALDVLRDRNFGALHLDNLLNHFLGQSASCIECLFTCKEIND